MKIAIKKFHFVIFVGFVFMASGSVLFSLLFQALVNSGWYGFIFLFLFLVSLVGLVNYFFEYKSKVESAREASKQVVNEKLETNPELFTHTSPELLRQQIESHLLNKIDEEKYVILNKKWRN